MLKTERFLDLYVAYIFLIAKIFFLNVCIHHGLKYETLNFARLRLKHVSERKQKVSYLTQSDKVKGLAQAKIIKNR